jgi:hypothetical protein
MRLSCVRCMGCVRCCVRDEAITDL